MPIQDQNPERRNLMICSLAFLVFFLAEGSIQGGPARLAIINVTFGSTATLAVMAWVALLWFAYRYHQTHKRQFMRDLRSEVATKNGRNYVWSWASRKINEPIVARNKEGWSIADMRWPSYRAPDYQPPPGEKFSYLEVTIAHHKGDGARGMQQLPPSEGEDSSRTLLASGIFGRYLYTRLLLDCAWNDAAISNYLVPYLLFWTTVVVAIYKSWIPLVIEKFVEVAFATASQIS